MAYNDEKSVSLKELREKFYELRDLEIKNLWQRTSILMGVIGLFFAGYGYLVLGLLKEKTEESIPPLPAHFLCCVIATLAILFSIIWITMTKGAKAWFEVQERKIYEIEQEEELGIPFRFRMRKLSYPGSKLNNCILSTKSGQFSVSKLNILLGQVLFVCWVIILIIHGSLIFIGSSFFERMEYQNLWCFIIVGCIVFFILWVVSFLITNITKSGDLLTEEEYIKERYDLLEEDLNFILGDNSLYDYLLGRIKKNLKLILDKDIDENIKKMSSPHSLKKKKLKKRLNAEISAFFREVIDFINNRS